MEASLTVIASCFLHLFGWQMNTVANKSINVNNPLVVDLKSTQLVGLLWL